MAATGLKLPMSSNASADRPRAFVTRMLPDPILQTLQEAARISVWPEDRPPTPEELARGAADAEGLLCLLTDRIDSSFLDSAPHLRVVSQMAVGTDNIDVDECTRRGIPVGNTPGVLTETTADLAFGLILATARRIVEADRFLRAGKWQTWSPMLLTGPDVHHATLGIVGMGRIGFEVARRARGFQMRVLYHSRSRHEDAETEFGAEYRPLDDLLAESDFVSVHAPLTRETRGIIGRRQLRRMKRTAILVNTSRGPLVDEAALVDALRTQTIAGAGLDVFETEPLSLSSPLLQLPNVVLNPHIGSASVQTRTRMAEIAARNLIAGLESKPLPYSVNSP